MIFLSYRREDEQGYVARLADGLGQAFGDDKVFRDVDSLPAGRSWKVGLDEMLENSTVLLAIMGSHWEAALVEKKQHQSIDEPDYVRYELERARELGVPIIPVLLHDDKFPAIAPSDSLHWLTELQAFTLQDGQNRWNVGLSALVDRIEGYSTLKKTRPITPDRNRNRLYLALAALLILGASLLFVQIKNTKPNDVNNSTAALQSNNFPIPLGQLAHNWEDVSGLSIFLDAPADSPEEKVLQNFIFPASAGKIGELLNQYCKANQRCIGCSASPQGSSIDRAKLITIRLENIALTTKHVMRTEDGENVWPIQDEYQLWENIDRATGTRHLFGCGA